MDICLFNFIETLSNTLIWRIEKWKQICPFKVSIG